MKIYDILKKKNGFAFSCEFFPPKTEESLAQLYETAADLKRLDPAFVSVTYGAGGGTRDKTLEITRRIKSELGIESMAHLTCVGHSKAELKTVLDKIRDAGIENIIALRGDPPRGATSFQPHPDGFAHAAELVRFVRGSYDFCIAVAGYPEGHVEAPDRETDWRRLEDKVKAGADLIITQLFFDNRDFFAFEKRMREKGVTAPIVPGIMPVTNFSQLVRFTQMCGARVPEALHRRLEAAQDDAEAVQQIGIEHATAQCEELIRRGVPAVHFYTLNRSRSTRTVVENLKGKP